MKTKEKEGQRAKQKRERDLNTSTDKAAASKKWRESGLRLQFPSEVFTHYTTSFHFVAKCSVQHPSK